MFNRDEIITIRRRLDRIEYRFDPGRRFPGITPKQTINMPHEAKKAHDRLIKAERKVGFREAYKPNPKNIIGRIEKLEERLSL